MLRHPGYWLLLIQAGGFVSAMTFYVVGRIGINILTPFGWILSTLFMAVLYGMAARFALEWRWKLLLVAFATLHAVAFLYYFGVSRAIH